MLLKVESTYNSKQEQRPHELKAKASSSSNARLKRYAANVSLGKMHDPNKKKSVKSCQ